MTILRANTISGLGTDGPVFDGSLEFNSQNYVILPKGTTGDRVGLGSTAGALRYNTDSNKVELWDGNQWVEVQSSRPDLNGGARGVSMGGGTNPNSNVIDYINISSTGNAQDFGDLIGEGVYLSGSVASSTRGICAGGSLPVSAPGSTNVIQYVTISSTGNSQDFGDVGANSYGAAPFSNSTRGIFAFGTYGPANTNVMEYITMASTGNSVDFGDASYNAAYKSACASSTRGVIFGGQTPTPASTFYNNIEFVTTSTLGNTQDFGDLSVGARYRMGACSNSIRGITGSGEGPSGDGLSFIEFITIATRGNSQNFGNLVVGGQHAIPTASSTRGVFMGLQNPSPYANNNTIQYVTIMTQGNAIDFGDLTVTKLGAGSLSNAHGGL